MDGRSVVGIVNRPLAGGAWNHGLNPDRVQTFFSVLKASIAAVEPTDLPLKVTNHVQLITTYS
jgi:hypothetical protein